MLFIAASDGDILQWSDRLAQALGRGEISPPPFLDLVQPEDRGAVAAALDRLRQGDQSVCFEAHYVTSRGASTRMSCTARRSADGNLIHGCLRESKAPVSAGELARLREEARLLRALSDNIPICVWSIDQTGVFLYHDGKGLASAGLRSGQFLGQNLFDLYPEEHLTDVRRALAGTPKHTSTQAHGVDWESWLLPVPDDGGEDRTALIGFTLDVTAAKQAERAMQVQLQTIRSQQQVIRDLATPIIEVWDGVLTLPMVGMVDSVRTADVMQSLLDRIVQTQARFAILDLTGVDIVDTKVAGHLINLINAVTLLGAQGVVTGIRPTVAQTMVGLGLDLSRFVTLGNLRAGLAYCIRQMRDPTPRPAAMPG